MKYVKPDVTVMEFASLERLANIEPITLDGGDRVGDLVGSGFEFLQPTESVGPRDENFQ